MTDLQRAASSRPLRSCPACGRGGDQPGHAAGSRPGAVVHEMALRAPDGHPLERGYLVRCCRRCGCGYADVADAAAWYARYYADLAKYATEASGTACEAAPDPAWMTAKADDLARRVDHHLGARRTRLLDLGCGPGLLLDSLGRLGYPELVGVDPAPAAVARCRERPGVKAVVGDATQLPGGLGRFGCVLLTGVLEHLLDPAGALRAALSVLDQDGVVIVVVPDATRYLDPYVAPFEDFNTEHVNHFSPGTLEVLGRRCGLEAIEVEPILCDMAGGIPASYTLVAYRRADRASRPDAVAAGARLRPGRGGGALPRDDGLESALRAYASRSLADLEAIGRDLDQRLAGEDAFALWGAGEAAFRLLALPALSSRRLAALVDSNPARSAFRVRGVAVREPSSLLGSRVPVIAASFIRSAGIRRAADELGSSDRLVDLDGWRELACAATAPRSPRARVEASAG